MRSCYLPASLLVRCVGLLVHPLLTMQFRGHAVIRCCVAQTAEVNDPIRIVRINRSAFGKWSQQRGSRMGDKLCERIRHCTTLVGSDARLFSAPTFDRDSEPPARFSARAVVSSEFEKGLTMYSICCESRKFLIIPALIAKPTFSDRFPLTTSSFWALSFDVTIPTIRPLKSITGPSLLPD